MYISEARCFFLHQYSSLGIDLLFYYHFSLCESFLITYIFIPNTNIYIYIYLESALAVTTFSFLVKSRQCLESSKKTIVTYLKVISLWWNIRHNTILIGFFISCLSLGVCFSWIWYTPSSFFRYKYRGIFSTRFSDWYSEHNVVFVITSKYIAAYILVKCIVNSTVNVWHLLFKMLLHKSKD